MNHNNNFRPISLNDIIGQKENVGQLRITIGATKVTGETMGHHLFAGGPGLGKTSMAQAIANDLGVNITIGNGANIQNIKSIMPYVVKLNRGDVLFIDEIHRLPKKVQEFLFPVMEDFRLDLSDGQSAVSIPVEPFTLIGATTESGSLLAPLRDRFQKTVFLVNYSDEEIGDIIRRNAATLNLCINSGGIVELAKRARGVPRVANNYLRWVRDFAVVNQLTTVGEQEVVEAMSKIGVDKGGLTNQDRRYLSGLAEITHRTRTPVGLKTLVDSVGLNEDTILNEIEPFLLNKKIIARTQKGRVLLGV